MEHWLAAASVLAAITSIGVAAWQGWLQKEGLRHSLYDRRIKIHQTILDYLDGCPHRENNVKKQSENLRTAWYEAEFLFEKPVTDFIVEIDKQGVRMSFLETRVRSLPPMVPTHNERAELEILRTWAIEAKKKARTLLGPYLRISDGTVDTWGETVTDPDTE